MRFIESVLWIAGYTAQKMKFFIKNFFSKCDQIRSKLRIWPPLFNKFLMENFIFGATFFSKLIRLFELCIDISKLFLSVIAQGAVFKVKTGYIDDGVIRELVWREHELIKITQRLNFVYLAESAKFANPNPMLERL